MSHRKLTFRTAPTLLQGRTIVHSVLLTSIAMIFLPAAIGAQRPNIAGAWKTADGSAIYQITQDGKNFHWGRNSGESGNGTINGGELLADLGSGSATGRVSQSDSKNNPLRIDWSTGECFFRAAAAPAGGSVLTGVVTGADGEVIANAKVTATNLATKAKTTANTTSDGVYAISHLSGGVYDVSIEAAGLKKVTSKSVQLQDSQTVRIDPQMKVSKLSVIGGLLITGAVMASAAYLDRVVDSCSVDQDSCSTDQEETVANSYRDKHKDNDGDKDRQKHDERRKDNDTDRNRDTDKR